ncbi:hypothetical protein DFQ29_000180, partial [Apophysomyces sp. BC1021]
SFVDVAGHVESFELRDCVNLIPTCRHLDSSSESEVSLQQEITLHRLHLHRIEDKFKITSISSNLTLDDMYLRYKSRFRLEKALKLKEFYTVS